jgi:hypothetical protein
MSKKEMDPRNLLERYKQGDLTDAEEDNLVVV